ncbi:MAG: hypothetical protein JNK64_27790 [Myxococcales bacterium]|nr:hypothetical protein [Myxococcales bacterium]
MRRGAPGLALAVAAALAWAGCGDGIHATIALEVPPELVTTFDEFVAFIPGRGLTVGATGEPAPAAQYRIVVATDLGGCAECYRVDGAADGRGWTVHASDRLGAQYGVAEVFELLGYRFRHPFDTYVPPRPTPDPAAVARLGVVHAPEMRVRGLHLHTLHPTEALFALWVPTDDGAKARRIFDWILKNRGNYVQWVALDDILEPTRGAAWQASTAALLEAAHRRGLKAGLGLQLFGASSLQNGYDLIDDGARPSHDQIAERLPRLVDGLPFDGYELSFGEFFGADPATFVATVDDAYAQLHALAPQAEVTTVIHVGDSPDQRVDYMGQNLIYYFLVKFCDPRIVPQVHTVIYYNLFEDAGGAYHHDEFDEHRQFLFDRLRARLRVQYKPETAYWVTFDDSVPAYLPLYMLSRQLDVDRIAAAATAGGWAQLDEQLLFSTGWEWGYWQNDLAALRASYQKPTSVLDQLAEVYAPDHPELPPRIVELALAQHDALIGQRLAAYQAGRDALIDQGVEAGIVSQPDRIDVDQVAQLTPTARRAFAAGTLADLEAYAAKLGEIAERTQRLPADDRWAAEVIDGVVITRLRAAFIADIYAAAVAAADGDRSIGALRLGEAQDALAAAATVVARRHGDRHDPDRRLIENTGNPTLYQYGYLRFASDLCFWKRELVMADNAVTGATATPPGCFFP